MRQSASKLLENNSEQLGLIYLCTSPNGVKYIGQHNSVDLDKRIKSHEYRYVDYIKARCILELKRKFQPEEKFPSNPKGYCTALYNAFAKYGHKNFTWVTLKTSIPLEQLNDVEDSCIIEHNTLMPDGYNLKLNTPYVGRPMYSKETLERMSISHTKSRKEQLHKYRKKHEELKDVPQFVTYFESGGIRGYRIHKHPNCKFKQFADVDTPIIELKSQLLEFLTTCEKAPYKTVQQRKSITDVPKGISEQKPGRFLVQFAYKGKRHVKFFSQEPRSLALKIATEWMQTKKKELIQEESSETK